MRRSLWTRSAPRGTPTQPRIRQLRGVPTYKLVWDPRQLSARFAVPPSFGERMRRLIPALLSALLITPNALAAQDATQAWLLTPGRRVRVTYAGDNARVGTLVALAPDTLAVQWADGAGTARMSRTRVTRLDVSRGIRPSDRKARAQVGFAVGGGLGLLIGLVSSKSNSQCASSTCDDIVNGLATGIGALMLGGIGAAVGAISGGASEDWEDVRLTRPRLGVVIPARAHGTGLGLALAF